MTDLQFQLSWLNSELRLLSVYVCMGFLWVLQFSPSKYISLGGQVMLNYRKCECLYRSSHAIYWCPIQGVMQTYCCLDQEKAGTEDE